MGSISELPNRSSQLFLRNVFHTYRLAHAFKQHKDHAATPDLLVMEHDFPGSVQRRTPHAGAGLFCGRS